MDIWSKETVLSASSGGILGNLSCPLRFETFWGLLSLPLPMEEGWEAPLSDRRCILMAEDPRLEISVSDLKLKFYLGDVIFFSFLEVIFKMFKKFLNNRENKWRLLRLPKGKTLLRRDLFSYAFVLRLLEVGSVVMVAFEIIFRIEIYVNDVFLFLKNYF
jgi:hypothetical protein